MFVPQPPSDLRRPPALRAARGARQRPSERREDGAARTDRPLAACPLPGCFARRSAAPARGCRLGFPWRLHRCRGPALPGDAARLCRPPVPHRPGLAAAVPGAVQRFVARRVAATVLEPARPQPHDGPERTPRSAPRARRGGAPAVRMEGTPGLGRPGRHLDPVRSPGFGARRGCHHRGRRRLRAGATAMALLAGALGRGVRAPEPQGPVAPGPLVGEAQLPARPRGARPGAAGLQPGNAAADRRRLRSRQRSPRLRRRAQLTRPGWHGHRAARQRDRPARHPYRPARQGTTAQARGRADALPQGVRSRERALRGDGAGETAALVRVRRGCFQRAAGTHAPGGALPAGPPGSAFPVAGFALRGRATAPRECCWTSRCGRPPATSTRSASRPRSSAAPSPPRCCRGSWSSRCRRGDTGWRSACWTPVRGAREPTRPGSRPRASTVRSSPSRTCSWPLRSSTPTTAGPHGS